MWSSKPVKSGQALTSKMIDDLFEEIKNRPMTPEQMMPKRCPYCHMPNPHTPGDWKRCQEKRAGGVM